MPLSVLLARSMSAHADAETFGLQVDNNHSLEAGDGVSHDGDPMKGLPDEFHPRKHHGEPTGHLPDVRSRKHQPGSR